MECILSYPPDARQEGDGKGSEYVRTHLQNQRIKFIALRTRTAYLCRLFWGTTHAAEATRLLALVQNASFAGAGYMSSTDVKWGAPSCKEQYGFDAPRSSTEAARIREEMLRGVRELLGGQ